MGRRALGLLALSAAVAACAFLLPERFVLNAPVENLLFGWGRDAPGPEVVSQRLTVPEGFRLSLFAEGIPNARMLRPAGAAMLVSQPRLGKISLLEPDRDGDGRSDGSRVLLDNLEAPHGMDLHQGWLYVAEASAIGRIRFDPAAGAVNGSFERITTGLPAGGNHWSRTLRFGSDGWLYVTVGSSCNVCIEKDPRRAAMLRFRPDGSDGETFATGLRNSVDFDWRPATGELYATDNGRDLLGDDFPPCELNRIVEGGFYGWPFANGNRDPDPDLGAGHEKEIAGSMAPAHGFGAHTAPLGMTFLRGDRLPAEYRGAALVALHGSWNRSRKSGYKVVSLHWNDAGEITERDFFTGLEQNENVIGRPVGVAEGADGAIYASDDYSGVVYRIAWGDARPPRPADTRRSASVADAGAAIDPARVERGRELYAKLECARCHEAASAPEGMVVRPLAGLRARYSSEALVAFLATPNPPMPVFDLGDDDRRDLAALLLATFP